MVVYAGEGGGFISTFGDVLPVSGLVGAYRLMLIKHSRYGCAFLVVENIAALVQFIARFQIAETTVNLGVQVPRLLRRKGSSERGAHG